MIPAVDNAIMIIVCPSCQARYKFDESKLGQRPRAKTKCAKCGSAIEIENPLFGAMTLPPSPEPAPPAPAPPAPAPAPPPPAPAVAEETTRKTKTLAAGGGLRHDTAKATSQDLLDSGSLELSEGKRYSLAVLQGAATGQIFQISQPRVTRGRSGADINLDDSEASRQHAVVEILGDHAILRDLGSTNGTFVESQRIQQHVLTNQGEFRIGSHVLMLIVTEVD
jgi:predicted Zn finger-like uncharacterized protein